MECCVSRRKTRIAKNTSKGSDITSNSQSKVSSFFAKTRKSRVVNKGDKQHLNVIAEVSTAKILNSDSETGIETKKNEIIKIDCREVAKQKLLNEQALLRSPKRNLLNPKEGTPPKKVRPLTVSKGTGEQKSPSKLDNVTPRKLTFVSKELGTSPSDPTTSNVKEKAEKLHIQNHGIKSAQMEKAIADLKQKLGVARNYQSNSCKESSIVCSAQQNKKESAIPAVPAYQRYSYLVDKDVASSLILPFKYKLLMEMFRSMDTVVSILNNRKEKITFEKVQEGVQQMMKRNFSRVNLGQIIKVMPLAFDVTLEKCSFKKAKDPDYQLIISPVLTANEASSKTSKSNRSVTMTPQHLLDRKNEFHSCLLDIVKNHHIEFLSRLNFPQVPSDKIKRWHPKFQVDSVPDIEPATLPEIPDAKIYSAKDVLSKVVKGVTLRGKVVKALESVAAESSAINKKSEAEQSPNKSTSSKDSAGDLKGVCSDLIAKIRARESAKLLKSMTESPEATKKKAMLERLPKIVQILWHYFIAERKAAVPIDTAVEKIIHSFNSLSTHEEVKAHLYLIAETFPGWLSFIEIPKGMYISMNKTKNINEMLDNFKC